MNNSKKKKKSSRRALGRDFRTVGQGRVIEVALFVL